MVACDKYLIGYLDRGRTWGRSGQGKYSHKNCNNADQLEGVGKNSEQLKN